LLGICRHSVVEPGGDAVMLWCGSRGGAVASTSSQRRPGPKKNSIPDDYRSLSWMAAFAAMTDDKRCVCGRSSSSGHSMAALRGGHLGQHAAMLVRTCDSGWPGQARPWRVTPASRRRGTGC
jgi:hypothetical protein